MINSPPHFHLPDHGTAEEEIEQRHHTPLIRRHKRRRPRRTTLMMHVRRQHNSNLAFSRRPPQYTINQQGRRPDRPVLPIKLKNVQYRVYAILSQELISKGQGGGTMPSETRIWSQVLLSCPRYTVREDSCSACEYTKPFGNALQHIEPHCQTDVNHDRDEEDDNAPKE